MRSIVWWSGNPRRDALKTVLLALCMTVLVMLLVALVILMLQTDDESESGMTTSGSATILTESASFSDSETPPTTTPASEPAYYSPAFSPAFTPVPTTSTSGPAANTRDHPLNLTAQERAFLESLGPVRFSVGSQGWPPFEFLASDGEFRGIASDYFKQLSSLLGLEFRPAEKLNRQEVLAAAGKRELDLLPVAIATPERNQHLRFTTPYARSPMVIITRDDMDNVTGLNQLQGSKVGVAGGYASDEILRRNHPELKPERYPGTRQGLMDVASGDLAAFVDNLAVATHIIKTEGLANLKIAGQTPYSFELSIGIRDDWPLLHSAIDKALLSMSPQQHREIYNRWIDLPIDRSFPWEQMMPALVGGLVFILAMFAYTLRARALTRNIQLANAGLADAEKALREKNRLLQELSITDKLTGVYNRHHLDEVLNEEFERAARYNRPLSIVLFDLDNFKEVNDHFGHQTGDTVLKDFAALVTASIRQSDIFGRWGGEEFLLICPESTAQQSSAVADKVRRLMADHPFPGGFCQTVSAGVSENGGFDNADQLILAADRQLYSAKSSGRNRVLIAAPRKDRDSR